MFVEITDDVVGVVKQRLSVNQRGHSSMLVDPQVVWLKMFQFLQRNNANTVGNLFYLQS